MTAPERNGMLIFLKKLLTVDVTLQEFISLSQSLLRSGKLDILFSNVHCIRKGRLFLQLNNNNEVIFLYSPTECMYLFLQFVVSILVEDRGINADQPSSLIFAAPCASFGNELEKQSRSDVVSVSALDLFGIETFTGVKEKLDGRRRGGGLSEHLKLRLLDSATKRFGASRLSIYVMIRCHVHEDKRPSMSLNIKKLYFNCFACNARGSVNNLNCESIINSINKHRWS